MRACELLEPEYLVQMLRAVKHLSMNVSMLEVLQNANAIEILVRILNEHSSDLYSTVSSLRMAYAKCNFSYLPSRTYPIISSRRATTSADITRRDKKKLPKPASYQA